MHKSNTCELSSCMVNAINDKTRTTPNDKKDKKYSILRKTNDDIR